MPAQMSHPLFARVYARLRPMGRLRASAVARSREVDVPVTVVDGVAT